MRWIPAGVLASVLAGCPLAHQFRSADPVPRHRVQLSAGAGVGGLADWEQETRGPTGHLEIGVRYGVADDVDLGLRVFTPGAAVDATIRLMRGTWSVALAPLCSILYAHEYGVVPPSLHIFGGASLIASYHLSRELTLSFGPSAQAGAYFPETGGGAAGLIVGAFSNLSVAVSTQVAVVPELVIYAVPAGEVPVRGGAVQLGLGVSVRP